MSGEEDRAYLVDTGYAAGGVVVRLGVVIEAAPIFKWMTGKAWETVKAWPKIQSVTETKAPDPADVHGTDEFRAALEADGQMRLGE